MEKNNSDYTNFEDLKEDLSIFFNRWCQRYGIMDRNGMTWSAAYPKDEENRQSWVKIGCGFGYDPDFNDGDW